MVYQAELVGFLRTVLIIILVIYALRLIGRVVVPWLLKRFVNKAQKNFEERMRQQQGFEEQEVKGQEGDIKITKKKGQQKKKPPRSDDDMGEYVDFEEVE